MLRDEVEKSGALKTANGGCVFCGQMRAMEVPEDWEQDLINELATEKCKCLEATIWANKKYKKECAHERIDELFGVKSAEPVDECAEELIHKAADCVVEWNIEKISIDIKDGTKGKISRNAKGFIKIERSESSKNGCEI